MVLPALCLAILSKTAGAPGLDPLPVEVAVRRSCQELRELREENRKLKQLVADLSLDKTILREALEKNSGAIATTGRGRVGTADVPLSPRATRSI